MTCHFRSWGSGMTYLINSTIIIGSPPKRKEKLDLLPNNIYQNNFNYIKIQTKSKQ